jgi:hypothetical protein
MEYDIDAINNDIFKMDALEKLYQLFENIDETAIHNDIEKIYSYKEIHDDNNIFIMIDRETLREILEKIPQPKKHRKSYKKNNEHETGLKDIKNHTQNPT